MKERLFANLVPASLFLQPQYIQAVNHVRRGQYIIVKISRAAADVVQVVVVLPHLKVHPVHAGHGAQVARIRPLESVKVSHRSWYLPSLLLYCEAIGSLGRLTSHLAHHAVAVHVLPHRVG